MESRLKHRHSLNIMVPKLELIYITNVTNPITDTAITGIYV